jgi:transposase
MITPPLSITSEQINSLPLLLGILEDMGVAQTLDAHIRPHGHWQGASVGTLVTVWLCHILQERDHRLVSVRDWVQERAQTFASLLSTPLRQTDCTDDRLANVLSMLAPPQIQAKLDADLVGSWIKTYSLPTERVRLDSTSVSVYHDTSDPQSLLQRGHSKDHRPDLLQFKAMLASLDPLGMPLCAQMLAGNRADDGLYVPAYEAAVAVLGRRDLLFVGDSKMAALTTRAHLADQQSAYLCAYRAPHLAPQEQDAWIDAALSHQEQWQTLQSLDPTTGELVAQADIYSFGREQSCFFADAYRDFDWNERVLLVRSRALQAGQCQGLQTRLQRLTEAFSVLNQPPKRGRKRYTQEAELAAVVAKRIAEADLTDLVEYGLGEQVLPDGSRRFTVARFGVNLAAWRARVARLGWLVYLSNTTTAQYTEAQLVAHYRHQPIQEAGFARLKTRNLHIRPVYLRDEQRLSGLLWLLCLALRVLTLVEYRVRTALSQQQAVLSGLNAGSPSQTTSRPTTERLIAAFGNITLTCLGHGEMSFRHVPALSSLQQQILGLLRLPADLYERLGSGTANWPFNLRE